MTQLPPVVIFGAQTIPCGTSVDPRKELPVEQCAWSSRFSRSASALSLPAAPGPVTFAIAPCPFPPWPTTRAPRSDGARPDPPHALHSRLLQSQKPWPAQSPCSPATAEQTQTPASLHSQGSNSLFSQDAPIGRQAPPTAASMAEQNGVGAAVVPVAQPTAIRGTAHTKAKDASDLPINKWMAGLSGNCHRKATTPLGPGPSAPPLEAVGSSDRAKRRAHRLSAELAERVALQAFGRLPIAAIAGSRNRRVAIV